MDKNDLNNFYGFPGFTNPSPDSFDSQYSEFNPITQYEQGYMYYRFLTQQLEYKIKFKEYEKLCNQNRDANRNERRVS